MRFSERTSWDLRENNFARAVRESRGAGRIIADLTVSNPTECEFAYDAETLLAPLRDARAMVYEPNALGMRRGRDAVAAYYADLGAQVSASQVCLTTSTSEGYSWLFRVLCDAGDDVLIARPSYPLFEFIARLDGVRLVEYPLVYSDGWHLDVAGMEALITERTRAVIVVHPNNPTGNFAGEAERAALDELCARRGLALIVDEVFLDYPLEGVKAVSFAAGEAENEAKALTFLLSGLSKVCGLPQMKVSWVVARGPEASVQDAMERLEVVADTFLSVNAPMQFALGAWLEGRENLQAQIRARVRENLRLLDERLAGTDVSRLAMEGGWSVVLRVPRESHFVERALERGVVVQPGEFYGLGEGRIVLSLLTPKDEWMRCLALLLEH
jgi:alanine-synthesizing transaminase